MEAAVPAASSPTAPDVRRKRAPRSLALLPFIGLVVLGALWYVAVQFLKVPTYILPAPDAVARALWSGIAVSPASPLGYYLPLWGTLKNAALGFALGAAAQLAGHLAPQLPAGGRIV